MKQCFKNLLAVVLCVVVMCTTMIPAYAASSTTEYTNATITLEDGSVLNVPASAIESEYIVTEVTYHVFFVEKTMYYVHKFADDSVYEGVVCDYTQYTMPGYTSKSDALANTVWDVASYTDKELVLLGRDEDMFKIVYSSFDYKDSGGNVIIPAYTDYSDDDDSAAAPSGAVEIVPSRNYDNILPSVSDLIASGATGASNNWFVFRRASSFEYDDDMIPVFDINTEWTYYLAFFGDDYSFAFDEGSSWSGSYSGLCYAPDITIYSTSTYLYRLTDDSFEDTSVTDAVLDAAAGTCVWDYVGAENEGVPISLYGVDGWQHSSSDVYANILGYTLIASSAAVVVESAGPYYWRVVDSDGLASGGCTEYYTPLTYWGRTLYAGAVDDDLTTTTTETAETSGVLAWLQRIYNAIVNGFNNVIEKIGLLGAVDPEDDVLVDEDVDGDGEEDGFSLLDIIGDLGSGLFDVVGGFFRLIAESIGDIVGSIGAFFDSFAVDSPLFDGFDDEDGVFTDVNGFFGFMTNLWQCVPTPVQMVFYFSFAFFVFFAILKMFH